MDKSPTPFDHAHYRNGRQAIEQRSRRVHGGLIAATTAVATPALTAMFVTAPDGIPMAVALMFSLMLSTVVGALVGLIVAWAWLEPRQSRALTQGELGREAGDTVMAISDHIEAILKLNPPAEVLEEVLGVGRATNQVVDSLMGLQRLMPKEDLSEAPPYKWLKATAGELKRVKSDLEEARFQSYVAPIPPVSLERSRAAIQEERAFVADVLARSGDGAQVGQRI